MPSSADVIFPAVLVLILIHHISDHFQIIFIQCGHDMEGKLPLLYFKQVFSSVAEIVLDGSDLHFHFFLP